MNMKYILTLASAGLFLLSGCLQEDFQQSPDSGGILTVNFSRTGMTNETDTNTDEQIHTLNAYRFENGILKESFKSLQVNDEGMCKLVDDDPDKGVLVRWRAHANLLFSNWLNYFVYQETPFNIEEIK